MTSHTLRSAFLVFVCFVIVFAAAGIGNMATMPSIPTWYAGLNKPFFNPPNWIFGPVWTSLYTLLVFTMWRILRVYKQNPDARLALRAFVAQLILNPLWSIVFFYLHAPAMALIVVVMLEISVLVLIRTTLRVDRVAALIQWPYAAWVAFATLLNAAIVYLN